MIDPRFQKANRLFVLSFENIRDRTGHRTYRVLSSKYRGRKVSDQPVKNKIRTYDNIRNFAAGYGDGYATVYSLDYSYNQRKLLVDSKKLSRQQTFDAYLKAM